MSKSWQILDSRPSPDGVLELRRRDEDDFLICLDGRVLMNSRASRSEEELGRRACADLGPGARVLVGGLGMGFTLRAVLDAVAADAHVCVAELHPVVAEWCRGPLAVCSDHSLDDSRVSVVVGNVVDRIREAGDGGSAYDAIVLDLFEGPHAGTDARRDPLYGSAAIQRTWDALAPGGVLAVWSERRDQGFESRLTAKGFRVESHRPGRGGYRHWIALATRPVGGGKRTAKSRRSD